MTTTYPAGPRVSDYRDLNDEIIEWRDENFGNGNALATVAGLAEEVGEVMRCCVKDSQGIRGTHEEWMAELQKELGDVYIKLVDVASFYGLELDACIQLRWQTIKMRNWKKDPIGHGIAS